MGDVGSLMFGALLASISIILKQEFFYGIMGLLFVIESLSSILQVTSYKLTKKRIFKVAPIHHHFEKCGWSETKVTYIFWLFFLICSVIALLSIVKF